MSGYRVVYVEPGKPAVEREIGTDLHDLQAAVGGLIECIYAHNDSTLIVGNDEAKLIGIWLFSRVFLSRLQFLR